jgi:tetratricopeptide (TPR) repeat protein
MYYTEAGERASSAYANREAEDFFRSALELAPPEAAEAHLLSELGIVLARQSRHEEAIQIWRKGIQLYHSLGEHDGIARLYARSARAAWDGGDTPRGLQLCKEGRAAARGAPESPQIANLLHETARACWFNGLLDEATSLCRQALEMAERLGAVEVQADALTTLGSLPGQHSETALAALARAVELAEDNALLAQASRAHNNLATTLAYSDPQDARSHFLLAAEIERQRGFTAGELFCAANAIAMTLLLGEFRAAEGELRELRKLLDAAPDLGPAEFSYQGTEARLLRYRGEFPEATRRLRQLCTDARAAGDLQMLSGLDYLLGDALWEQDAVEEAPLALAEAISVGDQGVGYGSVLPRCSLSVLHSGLGDLEQARRLLVEARGKIVTPGSRLAETASLLRAEAHLAAAERRCSDALAAFEAAASELARAGMRWLRARLLREWAEAHLSRGEPEDRGRARELLLEAQAEFEAMAISFYAAQTGERLVEMEDAP